jgi:signal transduction histidine kinase
MRVTVSDTGGGARLGLAIAKHLVQAHDGEIGVESPSEVGGGTTFYFTLPLVQSLT